MSPSSLDVYAEIYNENKTFKSDIKNINSPSKKVISFDINQLVEKSEFKNGHIKNSLNIPLDKLSKNINKTSINGEFYIHCAGGYRSMIASSILKRKGIHRMTDVIGGFSAIKSAQIPIEI